MALVTAAHVRTAIRDTLDDLGVAALFRSVTVFGSVAAGTNDEHSDIDLAVVTAPACRDVVYAVARRLEDRLGAPVQTLALESAHLRPADSVFVASIAHRGITVWGEPLLTLCVPVPPAPTDEGLDRHRARWRLRQAHQHLRAADLIASDGLDPDGIPGRAAWSAADALAATIGRRLRRGRSEHNHLALRAAGLDAAMAAAVLASDPDRLDDAGACSLATAQALTAAAGAAIEARWDAAVVPGGDAPTVDGIATDNAQERQE